MGCKTGKIWPFLALKWPPNDPKWPPRSTSDKDISWIYKKIVFTRHFGVLLAMEMAQIGPWYCTSILRLPEGGGHPESTFLGLLLLCKVIMGLNEAPRQQWALPEIFGAKLFSSVPQWVTSSQKMIVGDKILKILQIEFPLKIQFSKNSYQILNCNFRASTEY